MEHLMEALFDVAYLCVIFGLGLRLLLEQTKGAKKFGLMALILAGGDSFHLLPRVLSHLTPDGFIRYAALLSWGKLITAITMTIFYLLFFSYYQDRTGDQAPAKKKLLYGLALIRLLLLLLPQNGWGAAGSYSFELIRNIPFLLMGLLLIRWTWLERKQPGMRHAAELIFLSFFFYLLVVVGARFNPLLGVLMIPKTLAYVLLIASGYRFFVHDFRALTLFKLSITFLLLGLGGGVYYREFTKAFAYAGRTNLSLVHIHLLILGFLFLLLLYSLLRDEQQISFYRRPYLLYTTGLAWTAIAFLVRGMSQVVGAGTTFPTAALSGIAGIGHILLGIGLVWLLLRYYHVQRGAIGQ